MNRSMRTATRVGALVPTFLAAWLGLGAWAGHWQFGRFTLFLIVLTLLASPLVLIVAARQTALLRQGVQQLKESEAQARENLMAAQRIAHLGSWEYDVRTGRYTLSQELYDILGIDPTTFVPSVQSFLSMVPEDEREAMLRIGRNLYANPRPLDMDHRIIRPDGTVRWVHARVEAQVAEDGTISKLTGVVHDITLRKEGEEARWRSLLQAQELKRLRELDRVRTDFINQAAHELRTPLTPLNAIVGLLERKVGPNGGATIGNQSLDVLRRNVGRLNLLVDELLDAARMQSDRLVLNRARVDLVQTVRASVQTYQAAAQAQGKRLMLVAPERALSMADEVRIAQVLDNLLDNALKFTEPGGRVHVEVSLRASDVLVSVYDDGVGLSEEQRVRLFEPFSRPHEHLHRHRTGTGLGLYLSRNIVELHGGHIWCESGGQGRGSVFSFTVPAELPEATTRTDESSVFAVRALSQERLEPMQ